MNYELGINEELIIRNEELIPNSQFLIPNSSNLSFQFLIYEADRQPVGIYIKEKPFTENIIKLQKDDILYIFTDGYYSQYGGPKNMFMKTKYFKQILTEIYNLQMLEQKQILENKFIEWKGNKEQTDDVLVIGIKI